MYLSSIKEMGMLISKGMSSIYYWKTWRFRNFNFLGKKIWRNAVALKNKKLQRGTHLTFHAIRDRNKNVLAFCLHKILVKCRVSISKSSIWFYIDSSVQ